MTSGRIIQSAPLPHGRGWRTGGVILSEGLYYAAKKQADRVRGASYHKGMSDAVKQKYPLYASMQQQRVISALKRERGAGIG